MRSSSGILFAALEIHYTFEFNLSGYILCLRIFFW